MLNICNIILFKWSLRLNIMDGVDFTIRTAGFFVFLVSFSILNQIVYKHTTCAIINICTINCFDTGKLLFLLIVGMRKCLRIYFLIYLSFTSFSTESFNTQKLKLQTHYKFSILKMWCVESEC